MLVFQCFIFQLHIHCSTSRSDQISPITVNEILSSHYPVTLIIIMMLCMPWLTTWPRVQVLFINFCSSCWTKFYPEWKVQECWRTKICPSTVLAFLCLNTENCSGSLVIVPSFYFLHSPCQQLFRHEHPQESSFKQAISEPSRHTFHLDEHGVCVGISEHILMMGSARYVIIIPKTELQCWTNHELFIALWCNKTLLNELHSPYSLCKQRPSPSLQKCPVPRSCRQQFRTHPGWSGDQSRSEGHTSAPT